MSQTCSKSFIYIHYLLLWMAPLKWAQLSSLAFCRWENIHRDEVTWPRSSHGLMMNGIQHRLADCPSSFAQDWGVSQDIRTSIVKTAVVPGKLEQFVRLDQGCLCSCSHFEVLNSSVSQVEVGAFRVWTFLYVILKLAFSLSILWPCFVMCFLY